MAMSPAARPAPGRRWTAALAWALAGLSVLALAPAGRLATLSQRARLPSMQLPAVAVGAVILATVSTAAVPVVATLASVVQPDPLAPDWYGARLRGQVDLDTLTAEVLGVAEQTMQPTRASLWLRPPAGGSR